MRDETTIVHADGWTAISAVNLRFPLADQFTVDVQLQRTCDGLWQRRLRGIGGMQRSLLLRNKNALGELQAKADIHRTIVVESDAKEKPVFSPVIEGKNIWLVFTQPGQYRDEDPLAVAGEATDIRFQFILFSKESEDARRASIFPLPTDICR